MPERVQLRRTKGWRMPPNTVKVARPGPWGNPYYVGMVGVPDAATAVRKYREWIGATIALDHPNPKCTIDALAALLRGKNLACWCVIGEPCHADVLLEIANPCPHSYPPNGNCPWCPPPFEPTKLHLQRAQRLVALANTEKEKQ